METSHNAATPPPDPGADVPWEQRLRLLLDSTDEGVFGIDLAGNCRYINEAGARMIGLPADALLGRNMHALTHHTHADGSVYAEADCPIFNAFRRGMPCRLDNEVFWRADGRSFAVEYSSHPIVEQGAVCGAVIAFADITGRKRAAEDLQQAHDALARANDGLERRVAARTRELTEALEQLRELSAYSEQVREDERTRIAREVHDELGSLLVALKMDVNWLHKRLGEQGERTPEAAGDMRQQMRCKCQNMSRLIETAVDNVGRIITDLRPSILDHQGLWAALEWQAQEFAQSAEIALDWRCVPPPGDLPEAAAMAVFRIFQEILSNVGRHARAGSLAVDIGLREGWLQMRVQDDGVGAAPQALESPTAYGVMGMRERARQLGGRLAITSASGAGSCVLLEVPWEPVP
ncbi:PAS domain S-box protein [Acidovorax sp.]|uniref:sensor histidine kinase n=1 Tax=Acidovorax sp. TaxID=1872122 RepID=UPI00391F4760